MGIPGDSGDGNGDIPGYSGRIPPSPLNRRGDSGRQLRHQFPQIRHPMQRLLQADEKKLHLIDGLARSRFQRGGVGRLMPLATLQQGVNPRLANVIRFVVNHHQIPIRIHPNAPTPGLDGLLGLGRLNWCWLILIFAALTALAIQLIRRWRQERGW